MKRRNNISFRPILMFICIIMIILIVLDIEMRPVLVNAAKRAVKNKFISTVNTCVEELLESEQYTSFYNIVRDNNGKIQNVELNQHYTNTFKGKLYSKIIEEYNNDDYTSVTVPISSALNISLLPLPSWEWTVRFKSPTALNTKITTEFTSSGINQTLQIIKLMVDADIYVIMSGGRLTQKCEYEYILCENIIVGDVPNTYLNITE